MLKIQNNIKPESCRVRVRTTRAYGSFFYCQKLKSMEQTTVAVLSIEQIKEIVRMTVAQFRGASANDKPLEMMSASEVKQRYDISDTTLWRWQRAGLVHPVRIGRERRYDRREIEAMFAK